MKRHSLYVLLALALAAAMFVPQSGSAQAKAWHSPSGWRWSIDSICRDGVRVTMRYSTDNPSSPYGITLDFAAYQRLGNTEGQRIPTEPLKKDGFVWSLQYKFLGDASVTVTYHQDPLPWTNDENGTSGLASYWGSKNLSWETLPTGQSTLPLGTRVVVLRPGTTQYFLGAVTDCYLFQ